MTEHWKAWKTKSRFSTLPSAPWKSRKGSEISTFPQVLLPLPSRQKNRGRRKNSGPWKSGNPKAGFLLTNVASLIGQDNFRANTDFQARTIERLTSGLRINSSGDDAAGLSVANKFRSDQAELQQGIRNANDGISALQIVDGGLNNISKILDCLKTLATQSSTTTF